MSSSTATIASAALSATIASMGAELQTLQTAAGRNLLWDGDPAFWTGRAPILFPVIGMLNGGVYRYDGMTFAMPKHGFARRRDFTVIAQSDASVTLQLSADAETRAIYPFDFTLDIAFTLAAASLTVTAILANHGAAPMPASFGFHPALRWPLPFGQTRAAHRLVFDADELAPVRRIDPEGLLKPNPVATPVVGARLALRDDLFVEDALIFDALRSRGVQYGADEGPQLKVEFADFPTLGVWSKPGAGFVCIEPWQGSSDPEGFVGDIRDKPGIVMVEPGSARQQAMSITLRD